MNRQDVRGEAQRFGVRRRIQAVDVGMLILGCALGLSFLALRSSVEATSGPILQILGDFNTTHLLSDVIHLGDNPNDSRFIPPNPSGTTYSRSFEVTAATAASGQVLLIDQYQADNDDPTKRSFVTVNGVFIGRFTRNASISDLTGRNTMPVVTDSFALPRGVLHQGTNTVTIEAGLSNPGGTDQYDDFSFTNIRIPLPITDSDGDGVGDDIDECPDTPPGEPVDAEGCSDSQRDADGDGVDDDEDECPDTPTGTAVDENGCPLDTLVRFDVDRNGLTSFTDDSDKSDPASPFRFWLNADRDAFDTNDGVIADLDPATGASDARDAHITNVRDLEDFAKVAVRLPSSFEIDSPDWSVEARLTPTVGAPIVNLFRAVAPDDRYLSDLGTAQSQLLVGLAEQAIPVAGSPVPLPRALFSSSDRTAHLIFEGSLAGCGEFSVHVLKLGVEVSRGSAHVCLHDVGAFYDHWTVGNHVGFTVGSLQQINHAAPEVVDSSSTDRIVFVHGWRMWPWERRAFAETAFKRMWHQGYKGRFELFSWPTGWVPRPCEPLRGRCPAWQQHVRENYDQSELAAWQSARRLREHLESLFIANRESVNILAHSMGNVVVSEALRQEARSGARLLVSTYVASQGAVPATAYFDGILDEYSMYPLDGVPYFADIALPARRTVNFFNREDDALEWGWRVNNASKPDQGCHEVSQGNGRNRPHDPDPLRVYRRRNRRLVFGPDTYEIFAFCAQSGLSTPIGAIGAVESFDESVDLNQRFGFGDDHSSQFMNEIQTRRSYWLELLDRMRIFRRS